MLRVDKDGASKSGCQRAGTLRQSEYGGPTSGASRDGGILSNALNKFRGYLRLTNQK